MVVYLVVFTVISIIVLMTLIVPGDNAVAGFNLRLKEELVQSANSYYGITGNTTLNAMGDRVGG